MTEETNKEVKQERTVVLDYRGRYICVDDSKAYVFEFPSKNTILQNYDILSFMKDEVWRAIESTEKQKKVEEEKKAKIEEPKVEEVK